METLCNGNKTPENLEESQQERKRWRDILHRVLSAIMYLAKQGIPFRDPEWEEEEEEEGSEEEPSPENKGRVFSVLEFLATFDPVLEELFESFGHDSPSEKRLMSYLSPQSEEEFVRLLGDDIKEKIVAEIKKAKYFGLLFDIALNSGDNQLCEVIRYVHIEGGKVAVKESFLGCFPVDGNTSAELTEAILGQLDSDGLDIDLCRSQAYDGVAWMTGYHGDMQAKIKEVNPNALFVPCASHSLNLCGVYSFQCAPFHVPGFVILDRIFSLFSLTPYLWKKLQSVGVTAERCSRTAWKAHYEAVSAIKANFENLILTLEELCKPNHSFHTIGSANLLLTQVCDFYFVSFLFFWRDVLEEIDLTQRYLQKFATSLEQCTGKLQALKAFLEEHRTRMAENAISYATTKCKEMGISTEETDLLLRKKGETTVSGPALSEKIKREMLQCLDCFLQELDIRYKAMEQIRSIFAIVQPFSLMFAEEKTLQKFLPGLTETYDEFSGGEILMEIFRLRERLKDPSIDPQETKTWTALQFLQSIVRLDFWDSVPNLASCLRLFLTVCISLVSCERDISKLELIKSVVRTKQNHERLKNLAILAIELECAERIDFDKVIDQFAEAEEQKQSCSLM